ncbi:hypothetical protein VTL71DRAFT_15351 [Oculimacula yallundae]|uniref:CmcJ-like methyltransferase n=1 Tax=Oculimacula yallundae TaxID=86028 RepID=A0ABR4CGF8_9HELO
MSTGDITAGAGLRYLKRLNLYQHENTYEILFDTLSRNIDHRDTNKEFEMKYLTIRDIRGNTESFTLDKNGFEVHNFGSSLDGKPVGTVRPQDVMDHYLADVAQFLFDHVDRADRVCIFDYYLLSGNVHCSSDDTASGIMSWVRPDQEVHVDHSPSAAISRVLTHMTEDANNLLKGRFRLVSVWKPLHHPGEDLPMAVCSGSSVATNDLTECHYPRNQGRFSGAVLNAHFNEAHEWYYLNHQTPNEALIMKVFDSSQTVESKFCLRTTFLDPGYQKGRPERMGIEVRALVFSGPADEEPIT